MSERLHPSHPLWRLNPKQAKTKAQRGCGELAEFEPTRPRGLIWCLQDGALLIERREVLCQVEEVGAELRRTQALDGGSDRIRQRNQVAGQGALSGMLKQDAASDRLVLKP